MLLQEIIKDNKNEKKDLYKNQDWLLEKIDKEKLSYEDISKICNVNRKEINKYYRNFKRWSDEENNEYKRLYNEGYSLESIEVELNKKFNKYRTISAIIGRLYCLKIKSRNPHRVWTKLDDKKLFELKNKGYSHKQIAKEINRSIYSISRRINNKDYYIKERSKKVDNNKPENFKTCAELFEKIKNNPNVDIDLANKIGNKAKTWDEVMASDFSELAKKHLKMLHEFAEEIKNTIDESHKPIEKVWYVAVKANKKDMEIFETNFKDLLIQAKNNKPEIEINFNLFNEKERIVRNDKGQFVVIKKP